MSGLRTTTPITSFARCVLLGSMLVLAGCGTTNSTVDLFCHQNAPIRLTVEQIDSLSDEQARQILIHNRRGERTCGWVP